MKKSDLINKIAEVLEESSYTKLEIAEAVVMLLEIEGMRPPGRYTNATGWEMSKYGIPAYIHEWEEEND